jgi:hypothetical protein
MCESIAQSWRLLPSANQQSLAAGWHLLHPAELSASYAHALLRGPESFIRSGVIDQRIDEVDSRARLPTPLEHLSGCILMSELTVPMGCLSCSGPNGASAWS